MIGTEIAAKLREAVALMNDSGAHWIKGQSAQFDSGGKAEKFCSIGAIRFALSGDAYEYGGDAEDDLCAVLRQVIPAEFHSASGEDMIVRWNDFKTRDWQDIVETFEAAAVLAEQTS